MGGLEQFKTSPRMVYPQFIEQKNPTLDPDFVRNIKNIVTVGINEDDEDEVEPPKQVEELKRDENQDEWK